MKIDKGKLYDGFNSFVEGQLYQLTHAGLPPKEEVAASLTNHVLWRYRYPSQNKGVTGNDQPHLLRILQ